MKQNIEKAKTSSISKRDSKDEVWVNPDSPSLIKKIAKAKKTLLKAPLPDIFFKD